VGIVANGRGVGGAVTLSTGLDPDKRISKRIASVRRRADAEARADDVAPVAPLLLLCWLDAVAAGVGDEVGWEAGSGQERRDGVDVALLVAGGVGRRIGGAGGDAPGVVVGDVGGEAADGGGRAGGFVEVAEHGRGGADVGGPAEPAGVAGVEVHGHVWQVELLDGVGGQLLVGSSRVGALGNAHVGDHVGEGVGLDDKDHAGLGVLHEDRFDGIDVLLVQCSTAVGDGVLAIGGKSGAVTIWEIVDDERADDWWGSTGGIESLDVGEVCVHGWDFGGGITVSSVRNEKRPFMEWYLQPDKGTDLGNSSSLRGEGSSQRWNGQRMDLRRIVWVGV